MNNVRFELIRRIGRIINEDGKPKPREVAEATIQALILCAVPVLMKLYDVTYDARLVEDVANAGWSAMCQVLETGRE